MKAKIHYEINGQEDTVIICGDTAKEVRETFEDFASYKHIDISGCWSEIIED